MTETLHILLVEDNPGDADLITELLQDDGTMVFVVENVARLAAALSTLKQGHFDVVLLDMGLPDSTGLETVHTMRQQAAHIPHVILTGNDDQDIGLAAIQAGAQDYLVKGQINRTLLVRVLRYAIERHHIEEQLRKSKDFIKGVVDSFSSHLAVLDGQGIIISINEAWISFAKSNNCQDKDYYLGANYLQVVENAVRRDGDAVSRSILEGIQAVMGGEKSYFSIEYPCHSPEEQRWFLMRVSPCCGATRGVVIAHDNITSRKQAENALQESEKHFRTLFEQAAVGMAIIETATGRYMDINQNYCNFLGYTRKEMLKHTFQDFTHPDDIQENADNNASLIASRISEFSIEKRYIHKDGHILWGNLTASPLWVSGEKPAHYIHIAVVQDITERKLAQQVVIDQNLLLTALINSPEDVIIFSLDREYRYTEFNVRHRKEMKMVWKVEIEIGMNFLEIITVADLRESARRSIDRALQGEALIEVQHQPESGTYYEFSWNPIRQNSGEVIGVTAFIRNITSRMRYEEEIRSLNADLEKRVAERTAQLEMSFEELKSFSYSVSHDLRAPLRAIDGFSRIIKEEYGPRLDVEGNRLLDVVRTNTRNMDQLITDLLALSRVGQGELKFSNIDMTTMANSIYHEITAADIQKKFTFTVDPLLDAYGDPNLMRQVWSNLISNAIKYTLPKDERTIHIESRVEDGVNIYSIQDSGVGFNPALTPKLFGVFQRLHKTEDFEGNGVGLAIVKHIIHRHGGKVWAEGVLNQGATFYFTLPHREI